MRARMAVVTLAVALAACSGAKDDQSGSVGGSSPSASSSRPRASRSLPSGSAIVMQSNVGINSHANKVGDPVSARVVSPVTAANGDTVIPVGATLNGTVTELAKSTSANGTGHLQLAFTEVRIGSTTRPISLRVTSVASQLAAPGVTTEDAVKVAAGAAAGAIAGRVIGGDKTGARVGAGAGAVAGAVYANRSRDRDIIMLQGAAIQGVLTEPFSTR